MKKLLLLIICIIGVSSVNAQYTDGVYILNEDWFGHSPSSINFFDYEEDEIKYRVFQKANEGCYLGNTTQYAQIFGNKIYFISKQNYGSNDDIGGRLIVADAKSLEQVTSISLLDGKDGRSFVGVDATKGYVGTSSGLYVFDIKNNKFCDLIEGTAPETGGLYSGQIGDMIRYRNGKVFATRQGVGVYVIDTVDDKVEATIELPDVVTIFVTAGGDLYAAENGDSNASFVKIDADTYKTYKIELPEGKSVLNSWGAWRAGSVACDTNYNIIYYITSESTSKVSKYDFDNNELVEDFVTLPYGKNGAQIIYGTGVGIDPKTNSLLVFTTESGWGTHYQNNWMHFVDVATGKIGKTVEFEPYYWFVAMPVFPDNASPEIACESSYVLNHEEKELLLNLKKDVTDKDNNDRLIITSINVDDKSICDVIIDEDENVYVKALGSGTTTLHITADSNGLITKKEVKINVSEKTEIECVEMETVTHVEYYTLQGVHVENPSMGIFIKKQGSKTERVIFK